jgi:F-type H+-transporting ATPase subunit b
MGWEWGKVVKSINLTFFVNLINFGILLYLLKRLLFKPAQAYLDRRRDWIAAQMESARKSEERAEELVREREEALKKAHEQSRRIVEEAKASAEALVSTAKDNAKEEAQRILKDAREQLEQERTEMRRDFRRAYAELAILAASRVLEREVTVEDHRRLLDDFLEQISDEALRMKQ